MRTCRLPDLHGANRRAGLSLVELLLASVVMAMLAATLASLALSVQTATEYTRQRGDAAQIARVVLERIETALAGAHASEAFPGCVVVSELAGGWRFPDTVAVWLPAGTAADPTGLPRMNELRVFCSDPAQPHQFWELTAPQDTRVAPAAGDQAAWRIRLAEMKAGSSSERIVLTDRLRIASLDSSGFQRRGVVRFTVRHLPSEQELAQFRSGNAAWEDLAWPLGQYGQNFGIRNTTCEIEFHVADETPTPTVDNTGQRSVPFFGSASLLYPLARQP